MKVSLALARIGLVTCTLCGMLTGCPTEEEPDDPVWGEWESRDIISCSDVGGFSSRNTLHVYEHYEGRATIYSISALPDGRSDCITSTFDVDVDPLGDRYEFQMDCTGTDAVLATCADLHFELECFIYGGDKMDCNGDGVWSEYPFEYERD